MKLNSDQIGRTGNWLGGEGLLEKGHQVALKFGMNNEENTGHHQK